MGHTLKKTLSVITLLAAFSVGMPVVAANAAPPPISAKSYEWPGCC